VVIPNAGHHIQWDNPTATMGAVRSFLSGVDSRPWPFVDWPAAAEKPW